MFFYVPGMSILAIYVLAAVLPAVLLMCYVYRKDTAEKEPPALLASLVLMGVFAALAAMVLERIGEGILSRLVSQSSRWYVILLAFLVVGAAEEGCKLFFLRRRSWWDPNFNYRFDGVVYAVFVSLGFAAFENILYVFRYGLSVVLPRALLAIPGHMGFAVFMGCFYGRAKLCEVCGDETGKQGNLILGWLSATVLHGINDSCAMIGSGASTVAFLGFIVLMYILVLRRIDRESREDHPL